MKPAQMRSLSPIMERHTPQHPLPDELKEMSRDATICQFCGVSYLIHHEIKKLEDKVALLESELEQCRDAAEREPVLRAELEKNKSALFALDTVLKEKDSTIDRITAEVDELRTTNISLTSQLKCELQHLGEAKLEMRNFKATVGSVLLKLKKNAKLTKDELDSMKQEIPTTVMKAKKDIESMMKDTLDEISRKFDCNTEHAATLQEQVSFLNQELKNSHEAALRAEELLKEKMRMVDDLQKKQAENSEINDTKLDHMAKSNEDLSNALKMSEIQIRSYKSQQSQMEEQVRKLQLDHQQTLAKLQKTEMNADMTIQRLNKDCRQLERELTTQRQEVERLKELQHKNQQQADELNRVAHMGEGQLQQMKMDLEEAKSSQKAILHERELMVQSHQNQIEQLRESFKRKLEASESLPLKAQQELQAAEEKHRNALSALEQKLEEDFRITLSVEQDKHSEAMQAAKSSFMQELRELQSKKQSEVLPYKNKISSLTQQIEAMKQRQDERTESHNEEKKSLNKIITQLEEKIAKLTEEQDDHSAFNKLEVEAIQRKYAEVEKHNEELKRENVTMQEEIALLQDTVRRECEERFELTDALSHARDQLQKSASHGSQTFSQSFNGPVSALNKLDPSHVRKEPSFLSGQTMKNLEMDPVGSTPRAPGHTMPSLRSLPDILPKIEKMANGNPVKLHNSSTTVSNSTVHTRDIAFGQEESLKRSQSTGSNEHLLQRIDDAKLGRRTIGLHQSKSADTVDTARRRIAAAVKRK